MGSRMRGSGIRIAAATVAAIGVVLVACFGSAFATRTVKLASHVSIKSHHNTTFTGRVGWPLSEPGNERAVTRRGRRSSCPRNGGDCPALLDMPGAVAEQVSAEADAAVGSRLHPRPRPRGGCFALRPAPGLRRSLP